MSEPVLYILMRNDLASMNPGKAMAQASHASNQFVYFNADDGRIENWAKVSGFGTVLVVAVNRHQLEAAVDLAVNAGHIGGIVEDPTYPYQVSPEVAALIPRKMDTDDRIPGRKKMTLFRNEKTCGYIYGTKEDLKEIVGAFPLYK